jgi:hypothetical protein
MRAVAACLAPVAALALAGGSAAVVGGSPDAGHPYAGAVFTPRALCSGAFVSRHAFLTAGHCFADGAAVAITFGRVVSSAAGFATAAPTLAGTVHVDPRFCFACAPGMAAADTHDVAVVVVGGAGFPGPYAELPPVGLDGSLRTGQAVDVVGYGVSAIQAGTVLAFGTKEVATTKLDAAGALAGEFLKLQAGPGGCLGDSGGPNLLAGTDVLVAITAFSAGNPNCNGTSYSERVDLAAEQAFVAGLSS